MQNIQRFKNNLWKLDMVFLGKMVYSINHRCL